MYESKQLSSRNINKNSKSCEQVGNVTITGLSKLAIKKGRKRERDTQNLQNKKYK